MPERRSRSCCAASTSGIPCCAGAVIPDAVQAATRQRAAAAPPGHRGAARCARPAGAAPGSGREQAAASRAAGFDDEYRLVRGAGGLDRPRRARCEVAERTRLSFELGEEEWHRSAVSPTPTPASPRCCSVCRRGSGFSCRTSYMPGQRCAPCFDDKGMARASAPPQLLRCAAEQALRPPVPRSAGAVQRAAERCCHVGDNRLSDWKVPRRLGMHALLYGPRDETRKRKQAARCCTTATRCGGISRGAAAPCANDLAGPPGRARAVRPAPRPPVRRLALFILESVRRDRVERLYFWHREGEFLARCTAYWRHGRSAPCAFHAAAELLEVSRHSTFAASVATPDVAAMMRLWSVYPRQSMQAWAHPWGWKRKRWPAGANITAALEQALPQPWKDRACYGC